MTTRSGSKERPGIPQTDEQRTTLSTERRPGPPLGLLDDASAGYPATESKDVEILRRLKLAILEGQHPYFKTNINLSNLQDLILPAPVPHINPALRLEIGPLGQPITQVEDTSSLNSTTPRSSTVGPPNGRIENPKRDATMDERSTDVEMKNIESDHAQIVSKDFVAADLGPSYVSTTAKSKTAQSGSSYTLGRYKLLSPVESEFTNHVGRERSTSDASTVIDSTQPTPKPVVEVKRESPNGSQPLGKDRTSSSLSSFASTSTTSTMLTSESGVDTDTPGKPNDDEVDLSGYDPKYGNKADYLRHQKARVKMIESTEEKGRRPGSRSDEKSQPKSPLRQTQTATRRDTGAQDLPIREPEYVPRAGTLPPPSRTSSVHIRDTSPSGVGRSSTMDLGRDRLPPPNNRQSPRRSQASRPASPPGRYAPPRPREYSPSREIRPQYLPYDDPVSAPARPRPVVSSPPRGSPPREVLPPRASDRQTVDEYPGSLRRSEARSFDLRPGSASSVFADRLGSRDSGVLEMSRDDAWGISSHGLPRPPPSRDSPPHRERTSFASSSLPANPAAGYRPQVASDLPSGSRYTTPYDPSLRRPETWASRDWDGSRPPETKPKLQDRFTIEPTWPRDIDRDEFGPRSRERDGYRREPSPVFSDGLRSGFRRPSDIETGMRPMKRSRPDEGYAARGAPGPERSRYDLDGRPASDYYPRDPARRLDDDYRSRPRYDSWAGSP
ncbi:hypothetical protein RhiLY_06958 [Ceratobasidium sp. AG-Ba]|nr:hypothetical protein RhiLY_06958 [Ceratobasidium sp. AG-Ba]